MKEFTWENSKDEFESKNLIGLDLETTGLNRNIEYERPTSAAILETNLDFESSDIIVDDKKIGEIGEISTEILENFRIRTSVAGFEIKLSGLIFD